MHVESGIGGRRRVGWTVMHVAQRHWSFLCMLRRSKGKTSMVCSSEWEQPRCRMPGLEVCALSPHTARITSQTLFGRIARLASSPTYAPPSMAGPNDVAKRLRPHKARRTPLVTSAVVGHRAALVDKVRAPRQRSALGKQGGLHGRRRSAMPDLLAQGLRVDMSCVCLASSVQQRCPCQFCP